MDYSIIACNVFHHVVYMSFPQQPSNVCITTDWYKLHISRVCWGRGSNRLFKFMLRFLGKLIYPHFPGMLLAHSPLHPNTTAVPAAGLPATSRCLSDTAKGKTRVSWWPPLCSSSNWQSCGAVGPSSWWGHTHFHLAVLQLLFFILGPRNISLWSEYGSKRGCKELF